MDWVRNALYVSFTLIFSAGMHSSLSKLLERKTAFNQEQRTAGPMLYPSVTMCPTRVADQSEGLPKDRLNVSIGDYLKFFQHRYQEENR